MASLDSALFDALRLAVYHPGMVNAGDAYLRSTATLYDAGTATDKAAKSVPDFPQRDTNRSLIRVDWAVLALYWALSVVFTWPLPARATTAIMGDGKDGWLEAWNLWWLNRAIGSGTPPYHFTTVFAPDGTTNYLHALNPIEGLITLPVQWLFGVPLAYNVACWAALALTAFGGYLLCRDVSGNRLAGFLGGLAIGLAPRAFAQLLGHLGAGSVEFYVLGIWCLYRAVHTEERRSLAWALWSTACLVASVLSHLYTALFQIITVATLGALWALLREGGSRRRPLFASGIALLVGLAVSAPFLVAVAGSTRGADAPGQQEGTAAEIGQYSADLLAFAIPNPFHPVWGEPSRDALRTLQGTLIEKVVFPGYAVYALALLGMVAKATRRKALVWAIVALVGFLFSLGPSLHVGGADTGLPLPGALFYALPLSSLTRVPSRFGLITGFGLSVCAALGVVALLRLSLPLPARWRSLPAYLACLVVLVEFLPTPYLTSNWTVDPWYTNAALRGRGTGAILEVPFDQYDTRPLATQIASGLPLAGGYLSRAPVYPLSRGVPPFTSFGLNHVPGTPLHGPSEPSLCQPAPARADDLDIMRLAGVRYLALHMDRVQPDDSRIDLAAELFPSGPAYRNGDLLVYDTGGGEAPPALLGTIEDTADWGPIEEGAYRWTGRTTARIYLWSGSERGVGAQITLASFAQPRSVRFVSGGRTLAEGQIEPGESRFAFEWPVKRGFNTLVISAGGEAASPVSLGMGDDPRTLAFRLLGCGFTPR